MREIKIHGLIERCIDYFQANCHMENRIYKYKSLWKNGILIYLTSRDLGKYNTAIGKEFKGARRKLDDQIAGFETE